MLCKYRCFRQTLYGVYMVEGERKLLIIGCSKRKRELSGTPAIEVYDGPYYRMLRKAILEAVDISILSAKYGLIDYKTKISSYERKMTPDIAEDLRNAVTSKLLDLLKKNSYKEVVINLGEIYMKAFDFQRLSQYGTNYKIFSGDMVKRVHTLKTWINENSGDAQ